MLGWVLERAAGIPFADLVSQALWQPMGAAYDAYITVDRLGAPRSAGGICATLRDVARVGELMRRGGDGVIPASWVWARNPSSTYSRMSSRICSVCAALEPEILARTTMYALRLTSGTSPS